MGGRGITGPAGRVRMVGCIDTLGALRPARSSPPAKTWWLNARGIAGACLEAIKDNHCCQGVPPWLGSKGAQPRLCGQRGNKQLYEA